MTEKRLCEILNELAEKNVQLKEDCKYWSTTAEARKKEINRLKQENEQLKQFKEQNIQDYLKLKKVCNNTKKENEELKNKIDTLKGLLIDTGLM